MQGEPYDEITEGPQAKDGFIMEGPAAPVTGKDGRISGETANDIAGRAENIRKHTAEPGSDKNGEREECLAMLTHDLKTPLTAIIGYCSLILSGDIGDVGKEIREPMEGIRANAQRMMGLVLNFLSAEKPGENTLQAEPEPLEVDSLVTDSMKNMEPQIKDKRLITDFGLEPGLPAVLADRGQMERVLTNLISNAVKFTPVGGKITVRAYKTDGHVSIEVSDTGIGIPEEELPLLFEKYYQGKGSNRLTGTGLGLFIAKSIVLAHRGTIKVSSRAGQGAAFTVSLPHA